MDSNKTTVTRFVGHCQICEGEFKLDTAHTMVHHGYKRPGHGYIVGDCQAVGAPAYEQSCDVLRTYTVRLQALLVDWQESLRKHEAGETKIIQVSEYRGAYHPREIITLRVGDKNFARELQSKIYGLQNEIAHLTADIARCEKRIADWKLLPVRTVEELESEIRTTKAEAKAAREAKKAAKLAEKIQGYQKRIDSAVRNHTTSTLGDIFESAPSKLCEIAGYDNLTAAEALALLERNHVWLAFGLDITLPKAARGERGGNSEICSDMRYPEYRYEGKKYPWPEGLK